MARGTAGVATQDLDMLLRHGAVGNRSDPELLERFLTARGEESEASFAALVQRHGPMVQGVCRRILGNLDDADDAFQATFLVLARKARAIARRELLANWLYGVAVRTARELKAQKARRLAREGKMSPLGTSAAAASVPDESLDELRAALDEELSQLSDRFRGPVILCDLQGKTHQEAARILGLPVGTVSSRLVRARDKLRKSLIRRGLSLSAGTIAAFCAREASAQSVSPLLVAATSRAAVEYLAGAVAATAISGSVAMLSDGVMRSLWISKLASKAVVISLVFAASVGVGVGVVRLAGQGVPTPFERTAPDDWSWVDALPNADAATRERLKRCARSALKNYAALHRLVYDFDLTREFFFNDGKNHFTYKTYPYKGKLYWNEGAVRYDYEGENAAAKQGKPLPRPKGTYSVLRTRDMVAQIEDHEVYGVVLKVDPPPKSLDDWRRTYHPLKDLDPWLHYASCLRPEPMSLRELASGLEIKSTEDDHSVVFRFWRPKDGFWSEITCDGTCDDLPVRMRGGQVQKGKELAFSEETTEWKKTDGVWYPTHYVNTSYIGAERHATKDIDLHVSNLRANAAAKIPAAVFTLSDLPFPDGYGGWDTRHEPWMNLVRASGVVREQRPGEPSAHWPGQPVPFPSITDATLRVEKVEKEEYTALASDYAAKLRAADEALMKTKTESEQRTAIVSKVRLETEYAGRFLAMAAKHSGDRVGFDALATVAVNQFTPRESLQAAEILIRDDLSDRGMGRIISELDSPPLAFSRAGEKLLRAEMEGAATREARAHASLRLARHLRWRARTLRQLRGPSPDSFIVLSVKAAAGDVLKDTHPDTLDKEAERLYMQIVDQFRDVPLGPETMGDDARRELFKLRDLAIGKPALEAEGPDVDGKPMKLSDCRGKVVLLTFAGSWCRDRDYPVYRELVERMKGRPFALLCVNVDDSRETLLNSIKNGEITWRCWWEGQESGLNRQRWRANELPSVFAIDAQGTIRAKEIEGKALVARVDELVRECERGGKVPGK